MPASSTRRGPDASDGARYTVAASGVRGVLAYAAARRIDTAGILAAAGLTPADLEGPEARVTQAASNAVFAELVTRADDPDFGLHVAERLDLDTLDVVGHLAVRCATLGEAFARICAYSRILHDAGRVELERRGRAVVLYPGNRGLVHAYPRQVAEMATLAAVVLARRVTGVAIVPIAVAFKHPEPARLTEHDRLFGVQPSFDQPETAVTFDASVLALPIVGTPPGPATFLDAYARDVLARLPEDSGLVTSIERTVTSTLARGVPDLDAVATQLGLNVRTMQRRLADEGISFQTIVDRARRAYAECCLDDDRLAIAEIGFLVGFADTANFHRAFRRWTGVTPSAYRARNAPPES